LFSGCKQIRALFPGHKGGRPSLPGCEGGSGKWPANTLVVIINVVNINHYVNSINCKYHVTIAMTPPTINMTQAWDFLNFVGPLSHSLAYM